MPYFKFYLLLLLLLYFYLFIFYIYKTGYIWVLHHFLASANILIISISGLFWWNFTGKKRYIIYCQWTVLCSMYEAQLFLNQATFCWSVSSICINNWTWCKICMRKSFIIACNSRSCEFILKWLDFALKKSPNNGKWNWTLMLTKKPQTITF